MALLVDDTEELPEQFFATLHVPILPPVRVCLKQMHASKVEGGRLRVGCRLHFLVRFRSRRCPEILVASLINANRLGPAPAASPIETVLYVGQLLNRVALTQHPDVPRHFIYAGQSLKESDV